MQPSAVIAMLVTCAASGCFESHRLDAEPADGPALRDAAAPLDTGRPPDAHRDLGSVERERFDPATAPECPFEEVEPDPSAPYPFCQPGGGYERYCRPYETGHGYLNWHATKGESDLCWDGVECNSCLCADDCRSDADCPTPESGDAPPTCVILPSGPTQCFLTCDAFETCPTGMECVDIFEYGHFVCAWITRGDRCE